MSQGHDNYRARQAERRIVVWGCRIHRTPRGIECEGCADQEELLTWSDIREAKEQRDG